MKLMLNENDLSAFKRRASRGYPREIYGIMLGKRLKNNTFKVSRIIIPPILEATYDYVIPDYNEIERIVSSSGMNYIGSVHSHPQAPPTLSTHDYQYWDKNKDEVLGILSVRKRNSYKVTELKFWRKNSSLPVKFKTFKPNGNNGIKQK
ncbi:MAG TPA: Mov34/MPN/PAD-1 family protein [Thermodesulfobacteriota bacterium]